MKCLNCHSSDVKKYNKNFQRVTFGVMTVFMLIAGIVFIPFFLFAVFFGVFFTMTFFTADAYKCKNCKKRFSETQAKSISAN